MTTIPLESINSMNLKHAAEAYREMGFSLIPLEEGTKRANIHKGWSDDSYVCEENHWEFFPNHNIGCKAHKSGLMIVDIDDKEAFKTCMESIREKLCGEETPFWESRTAGIVSGAKGKGKLVFALPEGVGELQYHKVNWVGEDNKSHCVLELRCEDNKQDVLPPSFREDIKTTYQWHGNEILPAPADLIRLWNNWDEFELQLQKANPNYVEPKQEIPKKTNRVKPTKDYISAWKQTRDLRSDLEYYGYKRAGKRYIRPCSNSNVPSIYISEDGMSFYTHSQSDEFADSWRDAFDLLVRFEFGGDKSAAYRFVKKELARI